MPSSARSMTTASLSRMRMITPSPRTVGHGDDAQVDAVAVDGQADAAVLRAAAARRCRARP